MKVLFVGSYSSLGESLAVRLVSEKNTIAWITPDKQKSLWPSSIKGNVYRCGYEANLVMSVIEAFEPDCIVILNSNYREHLPEDNVENEDVGDIKLINLLKEGKNKVVCFISSLELSNEEILKPVMEQLRARERIVTACCHDKNLRLVIARAGLVYGGNLSQDTFVGCIAGDMTGSDGCYSMPYGEDNFFNMIHTKDFADALVRLIDADTKCQGIYDITTKDWIKIKDICGVVAQNIGYTGTIHYGNSSTQTKDVIKDKESVNQIRNDTGWIQKYTFEHEKKNLMAADIGISQITGEDSDPLGKVDRVKKKYSFQGLLVINIILFVVMYGIKQLCAQWNDLRFVDIRLMYVSIVAVAFGMRQGFIAVILASISYIAELIYGGIDVSYIMYSVESWIPFFSYGITGAFAGYVTDRHYDEMEALKQENENKEKENIFIRKVCTGQTQDKKELMKKYMACNNDPEYAKMIIDLCYEKDGEKIFNGMVDVFEKMLETKSIAIYAIDENQGCKARLMSSSKEFRSYLTENIDICEYPKLLSTLTADKLYVNNHLDYGYPGLAMPIFNKEKLAGAVFVYRPDEDKFTFFYCDMFRKYLRVMGKCFMEALNNKKGEV